MTSHRSPDPTHGARFPRKLRLSRKREFRAVFDRGRSRSDGRLIVYALPRDEEGPTRLGLAVGRRYGGAPQRNLLKRRVREAFRLGHAGLPPAFDIVVLPGKRAGESDFRELAASLGRLVREAARRCREQGLRRGDRG